MPDHSDRAAVRRADLVGLAELLEVAPLTVDGDEHPVVAYLLEDRAPTEGVRGAATS